MDVVRHNFHFDKLNGELQAHKINKLSKTQSNVINENLPIIFNILNNMIFTRINGIMIKFILHECKTEPLPTFPSNGESSVCEAEEKLFRVNFLMKSWR